MSSSVLAASATSTIPHVLRGSRNSAPDWLQVRSLARNGTSTASCGFCPYNVRTSKFHGPLSIRKGGRYLEYYLQKIHTTKIMLY